MKTPNNIQDKVILITGASMGIGLELCRQSLLKGAKVVMTGRNLSRLQKAENELAEFSDKLLVFQGDVCEYKDNIKLVAAIKHKFNRLDILIANAGLSCFGELDKLKPEVAKAVIDTNIYGTLYPIMATVHELKKTNGSILMVSSIAAFTGLPGYSAYSLSKLALKNLAQSLSIELSSAAVSVGIAFVGFTENEADKRTLAPDGSLVKVPKRSSLFKVSREVTAKKLLRQLERKKARQTHSFIGKLTLFLERYFPVMLNKILRVSYYQNNS